MLPLSYLLGSILCVAVLASLGSERRFRGLILIPLTVLVAFAAWQFAGGPQRPLPGQGPIFTWAWFPLAAAWLTALGGAAGSRLAPVAALLMGVLAMWGFAAQAAPDWAASPRPPAPQSVAITAALAVHRTLAVGLAAVALAALTRLSFGFPQQSQRQSWRFLSALSGGMLLALVLALAYLYLVQDQPLGLDLRIGLTVLPAETLAAFCVYRGVHTVAQPNAGASPEIRVRPDKRVPQDAGEGEGSADRTGGRVGTARGIAIWVLFVVAGGGLGLIPIILNAASQLNE